MNDETIGMLIRSFRLDAGLSQDTLAKEMTTKGFSWHFSTVAKLERGQRSLKATELFALTELFETAFTDFDPQHAQQTLLKRQRDAAQTELAAIQAKIDEMNAKLQGPNNT